MLNNYWLVYLWCSLYRQFPARAPMENTTEFAEIKIHFAGIQPGSGRTGAEQGCYQAAALAMTLAVAIVGGLVTGNSLFNSIALLNHYSTVNELKYWIELFLALLIYLISCISLLKMGIVLISNWIRLRTSMKHESRSNSSLLWSSVRQRIDCVQVY